MGFRGRQHRGQGLGVLCLSVGWGRFGHAQSFDGELARMVGPHPKLVADAL